MQECRAIEADRRSAYHEANSSSSDGAPGLWGDLRDQTTYPQHPLHGQTAAALREQITAYLDGAHDTPR